jgi:hypothetical protein
MSEETIKIGAGQGVVLEPTMQLRWFWRPRDEGRCDLQQLWMARAVDRTGLVTVRQEWQTVPTVIEGE